MDTLLAGRTQSGQQASEYLEIIAKENERLTHLIDNFLAFSRMERNKRAFDFRPTDPGDIVRGAVGSIRERFEAGGGLTTELPDGLPQVDADVKAMVTVQLNLIDNAWKNTGDRKRVQVRAFKYDGDVCFSVIDNGVGMSRHTINRIFDRFNQADQPLTRTVGAADCA